jgi:hypothetical protein
LECADGVGSTAGREPHSDRRGHLLLAVASRNSAYTVIVPIPVWVAALQEMAEVQKWDNFKNEVAQRMGRDGCGSVALIGLLHRQGNRTRSGGCS